MSRQVFPQAPSPTMTSFRRISAMVRCCCAVDGEGAGGWFEERGGLDGIRVRDGGGRLM